jgi:hypothetical protein
LCLLAGLLLRLLLGLLPRGLLSLLLCLLAGLLLCLLLRLIAGLGPCLREPGCCRHCDRGGEDRQDWLAAAHLILLAE